MMSLIGWAAFVLVSILFLYLIGTVVSRPRTPSLLLASLRPLDLEAFRNLADPFQTEMLRRTLSPKQFQMLQRHRIRSMMRYMESAAHNATILLHLSTMIQRSQDPQVVDAGRMLSRQALRMRLYAKAAGLKLHWQYIFPGAPISLDDALQQYQNLSSAYAQADSLAQQQALS